MKNPALLLTILCGLAVIGAGPQNLGESGQATEFVPGWYSGLSKLRDLESIELGVTSLRDKPLYWRLGIAEFLLKGLTRSEKVETRDYEWKPGTNDLRIVAGRAANYLERIYPIRLPPITETTTLDELTALRTSAEEQYRAYRTGVLDAIRSYSVGISADALRKRYQKAIFAGVETEGPEFVSDGREQFESMLKDFFPIGKKLSDLEIIMGRQANAWDPALRTRKTSEHVSGVFEYTSSDRARMYGKQYLFLVKDGVIEMFHAKGIS